MRVPLDLGGICLQFSSANQMSLKDEDALEKAPGVMAVIQFYFQAGFLAMKLLQPLCAFLESDATLRHEILLET